VAKPGRRSRRHSAGTMPPRAKRLLHSAAVTGSPRLLTGRGLLNCSVDSDAAPNATASGWSAGRRWQSSPGHTRCASPSARSWIRREPTISSGGPIIKNVLQSYSVRSNL
jgi:hypothetical protein